MVGFIRIWVVVSVGSNKTNHNQLQLILDSRMLFLIVWVSAQLGFDELDASHKEKINWKRKLFDLL